MSYKYLSEGNFLRKKLIGYNINKDKKLFSKIYKNFKQFQNDNFKLPDCNNLNNKVPIFILGMPRSGTTLVEQIISTHSKVFGAGELNILSNSIYKLDILNKKVKNLSQFKDFYIDKECLYKNIEIQTIDASKFNNLLKEKSDSILLVDVRENEEFQKSSIKGSISIPLNQLEEKNFVDFLTKESLTKEIFTLCQLGKRSQKASKILMKFKIKSKSIEGGIQKINQFIKS